VDRSYEVFCLTDPHFYDSPMLGRTTDRDLALAGRPVPAGWQRVELDDWLAYHPVGANLPQQGWKVHASANLENAETIAATVFDYCVPRGLPFKFVRSLEFLLLRNAKSADRGSSGKFAAVFPADEAQLQIVLEELGELLRGQNGPYILSDLRWGDGPLYVRYGGFAERYCLGASGEQLLAIEDPSGRLVPDVREPRFLVPEWVEMPQFLVPHLAARTASTVDEMPYQIEEALHFSNGGGLYAGVDRKTGRQVVLKEARPQAGLARDGSDAVARLEREHQALTRLAGLGIVPEVVDRFSLGGHEFLVLERIDGEPLHDAFVFRYPLVSWAPSPDEVASYTAWAVDLHERIVAAVELVHDNGIVIGDLHSNNVLVRPDGGVVLIDFEAAVPIEEWRRQTMADPGFMAPPDRSGFDVDRYALACMAVYFFLPLPSLMRMAPEKARQFESVIAEAFPVPKKFVAKAVSTISGSDVPDPPAHWTIDPTGNGWLDARSSMRQAVLDSSSLGRDDRLFPGDIKQFTEGGLSLAHGAAGVLYALAVTGGDRTTDHEQWLIERALKPNRDTRLGLYDGLLGVAYTLDRLGRRAEAIELIDGCVNELSGKWSYLGLDMYGGLSGIALGLVHFADQTGDGAIWAEALSIAQMVSDRLGPESRVGEISGDENGYAGLIRGSSGPALLFIRLFERTRDPAFLDLARTAIAQDLRRCLVRDDGALSVNEGWRSMPYVADGSVGIGMVIDDFLAVREDEQLADAAVRIRRAAESQFYIEPGLFYGRAGMILYLSRKLPIGGGASDPVVAGHIQRLGWHALSYEGNLAFPGEHLLRLSMDLASGTAGVLLAVGAALHDQPVSLPFLEPGPTRASELDDLYGAKGRR
jgi:class III lanthionine synthetase